MRSTNKEQVTLAFCHQLLAFSLLLFISLSACKKEINPVSDSRGAIALNFFPASDVLFANSTNQYAGIYVDRYIADPIWSGTLSSAGFFYFNRYSDDISEFPGNASAVVTYSGYNVGEHKLLFADPMNTVVLDTVINPAGGSYTCIYLADAPAAANSHAAYTAIAIREERKEAPAGQVGVRFVHLSTDVGPLLTSLEKADGSLVNTFPDDLHFLEASPYHYYAATDTVAGLLRFNLSNPANGARVSTGVPYQPGRNYVVVISGFLNDQQRQIPAGKQPDGSITYTSTTISKNLRAAVRRIY